MKRSRSTSNTRRSINDVPTMQRSISQDSRISQPSLWLLEDDSTAVNGDKSSQRPRRANSEKMTVQTMMGFVKRHPDEFAQSIELIRLAESIKRPGPRSGQLGRSDTQSSGTSSAAFRTASFELPPAKSAPNMPSANASMPFELNGMPCSPYSLMLESETVSRQSSAGVFKRCISEISTAGTTSSSSHSSHVLPPSLGPQSPRAWLQAPGTSRCDGRVPQIAKNEHLPGSPSRRFKLLEDPLHEPMPCHMPTPGGRESEKSTAPASCEASMHTSLQTSPTPSERELDWSVPKTKKATNKAPRRELTKSKTNKAWKSSIPVEKGMSCIVSL
mmetsp:Transcript_90537/g.216163  ORF Transcript_90537/g.216163 Transcript_90537/m.216163 type:complete len:330 (-) Transcript_90537:115-1104(-)